MGIERKRLVNKIKKVSQILSMSCFHTWQWLKLMMALRVIWVLPRVELGRIALLKIPVLIEFESRASALLPQQRWLRLGWWCELFERASPHAYLGISGSLSLVVAFRWIIIQPGTWAAAAQWEGSNLRQQDSSSTILRTEHVLLEVLWAPRTRFSWLNRTNAGILIMALLFPIQKGASRLGLFVVDWKRQL